MHFRRCLFIFNIPSSHCFFRILFECASSHWLMTIPLSLSLPLHLSIHYYLFDRWRKIHAWMNRISKLVDFRAREKRREEEEEETIVRYTKLLPINTSTNTCIYLILTKKKKKKSKHTRAHTVSLLPLTKALFTENLWWWLLSSHSLSIVPLSTHRLQ